MKSDYTGAIRTTKVPLNNRREKPQTDRQVQTQRQHTDTFNNSRWFSCS